jgi:hypothetical protein
LPLHATQLLTGGQPTVIPGRRGYMLILASCCGSIKGDNRMALSAHSFHILALLPFSGDVHSLIEMFTGAGPQRRKSMRLNRAQGANQEVPICCPMSCCQTIKGETRWDVSSVGGTRAGKRLYPQCNRHYLSCSAPRVLSRFRRDVGFHR